MASPLPTQKEVPKPRPIRRCLAKLLAGAALAAGIFTSKPALADPPERPRVEQTYSITGGARLARSRGVTFDPFSLGLNYSGFSYRLGDDDFTLKLNGKDTGVIDFLENHDYSDMTKLGDLIAFTRQLLDNIGVDKPGTYHHSPSASLEGFAEGYARFDVYDGRGRYTNELGLSAYALAKGTAFLNLRLDYDNPVLPLYLDSALSAGYRASMLTRIDLGMETASSGPFGFGITARKFSDVSSYGWVNSSLRYNLQDGFDAQMQSSFWKRKSTGGSFLPYVTLNFANGGVRHYLNAGPDIIFERVTERNSGRNGSTASDAGLEKYKEDTDGFRMRVRPAVGYLMAIESSDYVFPVLSFSNRDELMARGALGLRLGPAFLSGAGDTARRASSEFLVPVSGSMTSSELREYMVGNEMAAIGFFPSYHSRMMYNRHRFITSSPKLLLRNAVNYDREFNELSGESGVILSRPKYFIDTGLRMFNADGFGGGLYANVGNRSVYLSASYSQTLGGSGPTVQNAFLSLGGTIR